jgi:hypothetical protein
MVGLTIRKEGGKCFISNANYRLTWVHNPIRYGKRQYYILPVRQYENDSLYMGKDDFASMKTFIDDSRKLLGNNIGIHEAH